ncbi:unnamed protein product [Peronospora farinosa]|uniref:Uncharacterized protein n=1 Tax=Peronospora farinosa TaxID=134698 RepID=A0ABN8BSX2_9STRA|nr:unnamed protein product [Peronospora farinosa]
MSLLVKMEKRARRQAREGKIFVEKTKNRFEAIWQKEEADAMRAISEAKQLAVLEDADLPPFPRTIPTKFRCSLHFGAENEQALHARCYVCEKTLRGGALLYSEATMSPEVTQ